MIYYSAYLKVSSSKFIKNVKVNSLEVVLLSFFLWTENSLVLHSLVKDAMKAFDDFQNKPQKSME